MKKNINIGIVFLIGFLCTGCTSGNHEEVVMEPKSASEINLEETSDTWLEKEIRICIRMTTGL